MAGVLTAAMIPMKPTPGEPDAGDSRLHKLEHGIASWVAFLIVRLFGSGGRGATGAPMVRSKGARWS